MKKHIIFLALVLVTGAGAVHAAMVPGISYCVGGTCPANSEYDTTKDIMYGCGTAQDCYCMNEDASESRYITCGCRYDSDCYDNGVYSGYGCINDTCQKCKTCSNCTNADTWQTVGTGYQRRNHCNCDGTCTTTYRCAQGYFGTSSNGTSGCAQCYPPATTKAPGSTQATDCYIPKDTAFSDASGNGTYTDDCYYTK